MVAGAVNVDKLVLDAEKEVVKVSLEELVAEQQSDSITAPVYQAVLAGRRPDRKEVYQLPRKTKILLRSFQKLFIRKGVLMRKTVNNEQIVVPGKFHQLIYVEMHVKMGHLGVEKVVDLAQRRFYWPNMFATVRNILAGCKTCQQCKTGPKQPKAPLVPLITPTRPMEFVSIDIAHMEPDEDGFQYILLIGCVFSKYITAVPLVT